jgi:hypothetical protein
MVQNSGPKLLSAKLVHLINFIFISRPDLYIYKTLVQNSSPKVWYFSWIDGEKLSGVDTPQSPCSSSRKHITARTFGIKIVSSPPPFIYWRNFAKIQNWTIEQLKMKWFFRVSIARSEGKKILQIFKFGFPYVGIEGWFKIFIWYLVYSQIWINLPRDDHHFGYIKKFLIKAHVYPAGVKYNFLFQPLLAGSLILNRFRFKV